MIDLNGDGHADIVISERHAFRCWHSKRAEGYESGIKIPHSDDELKGPAVVFADTTQSIYLADMTGDGLTDIVRIRNGEVCYWPNLGHGRFGARIVMDNSPKFTANGKNFNQHYIKLGDIDGSGTTDIVYLGNGRVEIYYNCAGNGFSTTPRTPIGGKDLEAVVPGINFPPVDSLTSVTMIDLLGKGTMCLVWSTQRPGMKDAQMSYVDLMGTKPHLLCEVNDNMGSVIKLSYVPSTKFYLEDKAAGKPWITRLSFPVHCLERVETIDEISGSRMVTQYRYHHGYFDGKEREFRGFGVERLIYGESQPTPETHNLRGKLYRHYDQAGRVTNGLYSFKGEPITSERRVRTEYKLEADWATGIDWDALLEPEVYTSAIVYDALGKIKEQQNSDTSITRPEYHLSGNLDKVTVQLKGETTFTQFVTGITYNPKGQRERISYGNGTRTDYTYERETFRLTSLVTIRLFDSHVLQNIAYTYDPVGNITLVNDASIPTVFNNNQIVEPKQKYTYDALYRLVTAEGREHTALNNPDYYKDPNAFKQSAFIHGLRIRNTAIIHAIPNVEVPTMEPCGRVKKHIAPLKGECLA